MSAKSKVLVRELRDGTVTPPPLPPTERPARPSPLTSEHPWRQQHARWIDQALQHRARRERTKVTTAPLEQSEPPPTCTT